MREHFSKLYPPGPAPPERYWCACAHKMLKGQRLLLRCYSAAAAKSLLGILRRRSGFPIIKCKEALTKHGNDLEAAEEWLLQEAQREGWAKVAKLEGRQVKQGLVGLLLDDNRAAMVEVRRLFLIKVHRA